MAENLIEELIMEEIDIKEEEEVFIKDEICFHLLVKRKHVLGT